MNTSIGKAGRKRWMGWRPHNRWRLDEPDRSPARRRRARPYLGRTLSGYPRGFPTKGKKMRNNKSTHKFIVSEPPRAKK